MTTEPTNGRATVKDVYQAIGELREEMDRRFNRVEDGMNVRFLAHEQFHKNLRDEATSRLRWVVGTLMAGVVMLTTVVGLVWR